MGSAVNGALRARRRSLGARVTISWREWAPRDKRLSGPSRRLSLTPTPCLPYGI